MSERILIVDDDPAIRMMLSDLLEGDGFVALTARNGAEGVALARAELPAIVLMDVMMPVADATEATNPLPNDPAPLNMGITACSAGFNLRREAERLQVDAVIAKPFDIDMLLAEIELCLRRVATHALLTDDAADPTTTTE